MSIFEILQNIGLIQRLSANSSAHPEDVEKVKKRLNRDGYYDMPLYGITPYPDQPLFDGIRKFQRDHDLEIDEGSALVRIRLHPLFPLPSRGRGRVRGEKDSEGE